jgi:hypothetical protein
VTLQDGAPIMFPRPKKRKSPPTTKARMTEDNLWADTLKIVERYQSPEQAAAYIKSMQEKKEPRVLIVLEPEKVISWGR